MQHTVWSSPHLPSGSHGQHQLDSEGPQDVLALMDVCKNCREAQIQRLTLRLTPSWCLFWSPNSWMHVCWPSAKSGMGTQRILAIQHPLSPVKRPLSVDKDLPYALRVLGINTSSSAMVLMQTLPLRLPVFTTSCVHSAVASPVSTNVQACSQACPWAHSRGGPAGAV